MKHIIRTILSVALLLTFSPGVSAQKGGTLSGVVLDSSDNTPVVGAAIVVSDAAGMTKLGILTDNDGSFSFVIPKGEMHIMVSCLGYEDQEIAAAPRTGVTILLKPAGETLDAVVVTALGITRAAKSLNYSRQEVDTKMMNDVKHADFVASLAGKVAGVSVTPAGVSNGTSRIVIRGTSSLTENSMPVFVVDGMVLENEPGDANVASDGEVGSLDYGNPAADINPDDIESVEILKGPNAAALYGSRAANGVVLITTKKSSSQNRIKISYNGNFQFEKINQLLEYQNGWGTGENNYKLENGTYTLAQNSSRTNETVPDLTGYNEKAGAKLRSWGAPLWDQPIIGHDGQLTTHSAQPNNVEDFYTTAHKYTNTLMIEGGTKQNNYRLSYTNVNSNSVVQGINKLGRNVFNVRLFNTLLPWLTLDSKITFTNETVDGRQYMNGSDKNPIYAFVTLPRDITVETLKHYKDENGKEMIPVGERGYNPYWTIYENSNSDTKNRVVGSAIMEANILPGLVAQAKAGLDTYAWSGMEFSNSGARSDRDGGMKTWNTNYSATEFSGHLRYDKNFSDIFSINALVGASSYYRSSEKTGNEITSIIIPGFKNITNSSEYPVATQNLTRKKINSLYGSASFGFRNYLFLDVTARNDWSSTLPINNCSYFYPSVGGTFIFSDAFHISKDVLSFGKIRASLAYAGADTSPYRTSQTIAFSGIYNGSPIQSIGTTLNNEDLKPERTRSLELGTELRFLHNRLGVDFTYYNSDSFDLITSVAMATSSGYSYRYLNAGQISNKGYEIVLNTTPVSRRNFKWNSTVNYATNKSLVVKVSDESPSVAIKTVSNVKIMLEEGMPYGVLRGRTWKTDDQGRKLVDSEGKPIVSEDALQYMGCVEPKWTGSWINSFNIYGVSVNFQLDARIGGVLYSGTWNRATVSGVTAESLEGREEYYLSSLILGESSKNATVGYQWEDAYFEDGSKCELFVNPRYKYGSWDSRSVFDASFVKLREVSVGYNIPARLLKGLPISSLKLSAVGRNLAILYQNTPKGIDPEASLSSGNAQGIEYGGMPPVASYGFDIKLSF